MNSLTLNPKKMLALFLAGTMMGLLLVSLGWAKTTPKSKKSMKSKPVATKKAPAKKLTLQALHNEKGQYMISYPKGWKVNIRGHQMIARSNGSDGARGVFGIMRRPDDQPNEAAVAKEFEASDRPADLVQMPARVAGMQATKVVGSSKDDPDAKMVEYYVQNWDGRQYYILLKAPRKDWKRFDVAFSAMLNSISLN